MNVNPDVNFEELARSTDDFNGAQLKAVCVEAGMLALRRDATEVIYFLHLYNSAIILACYECESDIVWGEKDTFIKVEDDIYRLKIVQFFSVSFRDCLL